MSFLDADDLADMQADMQATFDRTGQISRPQKTASPRGNVVVYVPVGDPLPCSLQTTRTAVKKVIAGQTQSVTAWVVLLPIGTDIRPSDHIEIDGIVYQVTDGDTDRSHATCVGAYCEKVR